MAASSRMAVQLSGTGTGVNNEMTVPKRAAGHLIVPAVTPLVCKNWRLQVPKRWWSSPAVMMLLMVTSSCGEPLAEAGKSPPAQTAVQEREAGEDPCAGVRRTSTETEQKAEALRLGNVAQLGDRSIEIKQIMRQGDWTVIWATPSGLEQGVFFLRDQAGGAGTLVHVWGGAAGPGDEGEIAQWIRDLPVAPPAQLAACFVAEVTRSAT